MDGAVRSAVEAAVRAHLERCEHEAAITAGLRAYGPELLGYLACVIRDQVVAEEIFAEASEKMWRGIAAFRADSSFRVWAYRVAWNAAVDHLRTRARRREQPLCSQLVAELVAEVRSTTPALGRTSVRDRLQGLRGELSPEEQSLLTLRLDRRLSWREIAAIVDDADEAALRKRYERIKKRLRRLAEQEGLLAPRGAS